MVVSESITRIKASRDYKYSHYSFPVSSVKAFDMAIKALEKQIPKKPRKNGLYSAHSGIFRKIPAYTCPSCGNMCLEKWATERSITNYCSECGQKLDWSDT